MLKVQYNIRKPDSEVCFQKVVLYSNGVLDSRQKLSGIQIPNQVPYHLAIRLLCTSPVFGSPLYSGDLSSGNI